jgi:hypothetical protein
MILYDLATGKFDRTARYYKTATYREGINQKNPEQT